MPETITPTLSAALSAAPIGPQVTFHQEAPVDPELRKVANDVLNAMKYSFMAAAASPETPARGRADNVFRSFIGSRPTGQKAALQKRSLDILQAPAPARVAMLGRYGNVELSQYAREGSDGLSKLTGKLQLDSLKMETALKDAQKNDARFMTISPDFFEKAAAVSPVKGARPRLKFDFSGADLKEALDKQEGAKFKKVQLFIKRVHCIEETGGRGSDEINMGGSITSPDGKVTTGINQFVVSHDFDEGESVNFGAGKLFGEWAIPGNSSSIGWPQTYPAVMAMAEKDDGGFYKFLKELWDLVDEQVTKAIGAAVGTAVGAAVGAAFAGVGAVVGAIVGFIVGALIGWLISLFDNADDILGVKTMTLWLGAATKSYYDWTGLTQGPPKLFTVDFVGDGGHYRAWCYYKIVA